MKHSRGFTLIEIVITVVVLSLIILPIGTLFSQSSIINKKSKGLIIATTIAQDKIEEFKACSFWELGNKQKSQEEIVSNGLLFTRESNVKPEGSKLYIISVKVFWDGGEVKLVTYRGDH